MTEYIIDTDGSSSAFGLDQWIEFAAHLHPLALHLPIGLMVAAGLMELMTLRSGGPVGARRTIHAVWALAAIGAAGTGWLLGDTGEYGGDLIDDHRKLGIAAAVGATLVALTDLFGRSGKASLFRRVAVLVTFGLIGIAGHHGGMMTHGRTFLSSTAPEWLAPFLTKPREPRPERAPLPTNVEEPAALLPGAPAAVDEALVAMGYGDGTDAPADVEGAAADAHAPAGDMALLVEAFRDRCFECHNEDKTKGKLRLDLLDGWLKEVDLESDDPEDSEMLYRVILPRDDIDAMPPKGDALSPEAVEALRRWIQAGAPTEELRVLLGEAKVEDKQSQADLDSVRRATGARIEAIAEDLGRPVDEARLAVNWSHAPGEVAPAAARALGPVAARVVDLSLAGRRMGERVLEALPDLPALERVHLERSSADDAGVAALVEKAPGLRYLNLHSTEIGVQAVSAIGRLRSLEHVVLYGTGVGEVGRTMLTAVAPDVRVTLAGALPAGRFHAGQPRRILAADASKGRVALLREVALGHPELMWERPIQSLHDLQWLGETTDGHGRVLVQESWTRIVEVDTATDAVLWSYDATSSGDGPVEIHSFRRLKDGTTMVAESGRARLAFVDDQGRVARSFPLTVTNPHVHHDTRLVRPTADNTFLVAHEKDGVVREYDRNGQVVWTFEVPLFDRDRAPGHGHGAHGNQVFSAERLVNGDTLIGTGNGSSFLRVDKGGVVQESIDGEALQGVRLAWATTSQVLSNGNLVLGNCHAGPEEPQLIEANAEGEVIWTFKDFDRFGDALSNAWVIEEAR